MRTLEDDTGTYAEGTATGLLPNISDMDRGLHRALGYLRLQYDSAPQCSESTNAAQATRCRLLTATE
jgi:hypothetical protein